jgi:transposase
LKRKKYRRYSREFKIEAVRLTELDDRPVADVARELGIHPNNLYKWRELFATKGEDAFPGKGKRSGPEEELRRLRRENARLREERDILKKAVIFFSNESE